MRLLRQGLVMTPAALTAVEAAKSFKRALDKKVEEILETLAADGVAAVTPIPGR